MPVARAVGVNPALEGGERKSGLECHGCHQQGGSSLRRGEVCDAVLLSLSVVHADLAPFADWPCNDMVVATDGTAYVATMAGMVRVQDRQPSTPD